VLTGKDENLKDLKKQAEIPEPMRWLLWLGIVLLLLILAGISWWLWRRRRRPSITSPMQPRIDPLQLAEAELRDLLGRDLLAKRLVKQFYVLLSDIVKRVLEAGYGIHTVEKTTSEIMEELTSNSPKGLAGDEVERIELLLVRCDLVKFARSIPSQLEDDAAVKSAFAILETCRKRRAAVVPAGSAPIVEVR
jgi:LPXTG-motif cell wall-anchored protein